MRSMPGAAAPYWHEFSNGPAVVAAVTADHLGLGCVVPPITMVTRRGSSLMVPNNASERYGSIEMFALDVYRLDAVVTGILDNVPIIGVGANAGGFTVAVLERIKDGVCHAYEPALGAAASLRANQQANGMQDRQESSRRPLAPGKGRPSWYSVVRALTTVSSPRNRCSPRGRGSRVLRDSAHTGNWVRRYAPARQWESGPDEDRLRGRRVRPPGVG